MRKKMAKEERSSNMNFKIITKPKQYTHTTHTLLNIKDEGKSDRHLYSKQQNKEKK